MHSSYNDLYTITQNDLPKACSVLAAAFHDDPLWNAVLRGKSDVHRRLVTLFEVPVRYCLRYGKVLATSENLEGVMGVLPGSHVDMSLLRILRSGCLPVGLRIGLSTIIRMQPLEKILTPDRRLHLQGRSYLYVFFVGVHPAFQHKGFGGKLVDRVIESASHQGLPVYLETETEANVAWYEKKGFRLLKKIVLGTLKVPMWEMVWFGDSC